MTTPGADDDLHTMRRALACAEGAIGASDPNPRVGCVLVGPGWSAQGRTQAAGQPHAEPQALAAARAAGHDPRGATAYVSLEPCSHHGRTPPCCDALIDAGIARVVVAIEDPNPRVAGQGLARLRAAGIRVDVGLCADAARELNIGFFARMTRGRPWLRWKVAASLDGRSALADGRSAWITGEAARRDGHAWRRRAGAIVTGVGTVLADDPRLDVRELPTLHQPLRVIADAQARTPATARILQLPGQALLAVRAGTATELPHVVLPAAPGGGVDLHALLAELARREVNEVHVEAGAVLGGAFLRAGLVDELLLYLAPRLLGPGRPIAELPALASLGASVDFDLVDCTPVGHDLRLRLRPRRH